MDLFSELIDAVQSDLTIGDESSLFDLATVKLALNRSYAKAGGMYRWPKTEDALKTSAVSGQYYYDYPTNWKPDSVWRVEVDGVPYGETPDFSPLTFPDFLVWKDNSLNANSTEKKWANQWQRYFIYPTPTADGDYNICIFGQKTIATLSADGDTTIFSYSLPECNEAIVLEAVAIIKSKGEEEDKGQFRSLEAKGILTTAWNKIRQEQSKYEKDQPFFDVPDFFRRPNANTKIGDFD